MDTAGGGALCRLTGNSTTSFFSDCAPLVISTSPLWQQTASITRSCSHHGFCHQRIRLQDKVGIAQSAHLGDVQAFEFILCRNALANEDVDDPADHIRESKHKAD